MSELKRLNIEKRLCDVVVHNGVAYFAGQVPSDEALSLDVEGQTKDVLSIIDGLRAELGSDKTRILSAQVFLPNIEDSVGMNRAWDAWVDQSKPPARATIEGRLANPAYKVEIMLMAAVD